VQTRDFSPPQLSRGRTKVSELLRSEISSVSGLDGEALYSFGRAQIGGIRANMPLIVAINLAGLLATGLLSSDRGALVVWGPVALLALLAAILALPRDAVVPGAMSSILRRTELSALILGLCWAILPAANLSLTDTASANMWVMALIMISSVLAYCFASVPSAALLLLGLTLPSAVLVPALRSSDWLAAVLFLACLCYLAVFAGLIVARYRLLLDVARSEENCRRQAEIISLLLKDFESGSKDWLWETNAKGELVYLTDRLAELSALPSDKLLGKSLNEIGGLPRHIGPWQSLHQLMEEHRAVWELEVPVKIAKARRWWQLTARPIWSDGKFLGYRGVGRDVTEAHKARSALVQAKEAAERASLAKSQFLNVISHELRTPLNAIIGFSEIMAEEREGPLGIRSYSDYARSIVDSSRQLQRTISDILDASRIDNGTFKLFEQEVDAGELAQVALRNCRQLAAGNTITLTGDYGSVRAEIRGDLVRLKQILDNLLINAIKFTPALGTVELSVRDEPDGGLIFMVRDTGIGIEKKDLDRVFEPFVQADGGNSRKYGGIGLGLPIARKLAQAHGGDITLTSSPQQGTTAIFHLPPDRVIRDPAPDGIARNVAAA
jgi:PAS domain S-box-containing protein